MLTIELKNIGPLRRKSSHDSIFRKKQLNKSTGKQICFTGAETSI